MGQKIAGSGKTPEKAQSLAVCRSKQLLKRSAALRFFGYRRLPTVSFLRKLSWYPTLLTTALLCSTWVVAAPLTVTEKKAVRREMIEMDIAVRNLTTIVATGDRKMLDDSLQRLVGWQMKDNPELGKTLRNVIARWDQSGAGKFATQVQREAQAMRAYAGGRGKFSAQDWSRTTQGLSKILTSCQGCHEMTRKENP